MTGGGRGRRRQGAGRGFRGFRMKVEPLNGSAFETLKPRFRFLPIDSIVVIIRSQVVVFCSKPLSILLGKVLRYDIYRKFKD